MAWICQSTPSGCDVSRNHKGDGTVNIFDLVLVGARFGERGGVAAAPVAQNAPMIDNDRIRQALAELEGLTDPPQGALTAIQFLRAWLTSNPLVRETKLYANYPNPFNPETWIPYQLASDADVEITIYDPKGRQVRRLNLGHQRAGYYIDPKRAAHWDGRNDAGESVSSGLYFYEMRAGDFKATRKLVVAK